MKIDFHSHLIVSKPAYKNIIGFSTQQHPQQCEIIMIFLEGEEFVT